MFSISTVPIVATVALALSSPSAQADQVAKSSPQKRNKAFIWIAVGTPAILAFMANTSAREAASNLASWIELLGLPVPDFLRAAGIDERVTQAAATFYGLLATMAGLQVLKRAEPKKGALTK
jgi:hypothetical protein